ncbi:hypothetical protein [Halalkalibacter nanhaiisediminis]|uniref:Uncharacterized protein n=1 Tax=Halalkalibacter nanhaiisediminis TaxID=688079 RepID=A0A562QSZ9_9BACI|nr:hypothetical protein [Halalkalibacter nanhaiisediminis]TWI59216.1 hypothetical protein IQ10_00929 [Halalkalibacter nanhaiisediminis]
MIDLTFEQYSECKLENMKIINSFEVQNWTHYIVQFEGNIPNQLEDPEALVITGESGNILQIVLQEEGCDSPLFQFTESEKKQIKDWFYQAQHSK